VDRNDGYIFQGHMDMSGAVCFNANRFKDLPGEDIRRWSKLYEVINYNVTFIDRTGDIKIPLRTAIPPQLIMPDSDPNFGMTYEECCQARVREILAKQNELNLPIRLMYSGGIDSSLILTSFIKEIGLAECEKRIQLVMSFESIEENPWMWERVLRRSKFEILSSESHSADWGKDRIIVGGEFNDQLLGSDIYRDIVRWKDDATLSKPWSEDIIKGYHLFKGLDEEDADLWTRIHVQHIQKARCPVETVIDWLWWLNFSCKWNSVYFRVLMYARDHSQMDQNYLENYYYQFFGDNNFQKWSMKDRTHKIQDTWINYKWHARELVADFCGEEYKQKVKRGSLWRLLAYKRGAELIDDQYNFVMDVNAADWYEPNNSFKDA